MNDLSFVLFGLDGDIFPLRRVNGFLFCFLALWERTEVRAERSYPKAQIVSDDVGATPLWLPSLFRLHSHAEYCLRCHV